MNLTDHFFEIIVIVSTMAASAGNRHFVIHRYIENNMPTVPGQYTIIGVEPDLFPTKTERIGDDDDQPIT
jgi:hypothetical protein